MAKKPTKSSAGRPGSRSKPAASAKPRSKDSKTKGKSKSKMSASDALTKLLESPLAFEIIAAGAAAALATLTQQAISKKAQGGTKDSLKLAAKAAAAAMGARLASEIDEIVRSKSSRGEAE